MKEALKSLLVSEIYNFIFHSSFCNELFACIDEHIISQLIFYKEGAQNIHNVSLLVHINTEIPCSSVNSTHIRYVFIISRDNPGIQFPLEILIVRGNWRSQKIFHSVRSSCLSTTAKNHKEKITYRLTIMRLVYILYAFICRYKYRQLKEWTIKKVILRKYKKVSAN